MKFVHKHSNIAFLALTIITLTFGPVLEAQKPGTGKHQGKICQVSSYSLNKICKEWDGQWQGIAVASDGNCYFGTSTHSSGHGAGFHMYNPGTKEHTVIAEDMTVVCGEELSGSQQGKIHSPIVELDGWLYFTTHLSNYWPEGIEIYPGAHVLGYEMATGKFKDFGIVKPRYSIYSAINVDPERRVLYVMVSPFHPELIKNDGVHLYSVDIDSGEKKDLGQITFGETGGTPWFYIDHNGNCWFTLWKREWQYEYDRGNLYCYSPEAGKIITYKDVLPKDARLIDGTAVTDKHNYNRRCWNYTEALPGREKCLFAMGHWGGGDERLWLFDPSKDIASGEAFEPIANIGATFHETAMGGERLYFVQYEDLEVQRTISAELARDEDPDIVGYNETLHLRSISLKEGDDRSITDHGKIVDQDGRAARMINSMAADDKGRVYMTGAWYVRTDKEATLQVLLFDYPGQGIYKLMKRGEFFAVAETEGN
ncbi:MAG: hypothetical protein ABFS28_10935 [Bacteroidota bacterium]